MILQQLKTDLLQKYKYRIELHAHTSPVSACSHVAPKDMVQTYKNLGYDGIIISNHLYYQYDNAKKNEYIDYYLSDYEEAKNYGEELGLKVYLGAEIRFTENINDYLVFGINKEMLCEIYDLLPDGVEKFRKNYDMPDSVFVQAHPMRDNMTKIDPALLDGIEAFNMHPEHNSRVGITSAYAKENGISIVTAGSDYHYPNQNHEGLTALRATKLPEDSFAIAKLLKKGDYLLEIGRNNIIIP